MQLLLEKKLQKWKKFSEKSLAINSRRWNRYYIFSFNSKCFDNNWEIWPDKKVSIPRSFSILVQIVIFLSLLLLSTFSLCSTFNFSEFVMSINSWSSPHYLDISVIYLIDHHFSIGHWKCENILGAVYKSCHHDNIRAGWESIKRTKSQMGQKGKGRGAVPCSGPLPPALCWTLGRYLQM